MRRCKERAAAYLAALEQQHRAPSGGNSSGNKAHDLPRHSTEEASNSAKSAVSLMEHAAGLSCSLKIQTQERGASVGESYGVGNSTKAKESQQSWHWALTDEQVAAVTAVTAEVGSGAGASDGDGSRCLPERQAVLVLAGPGSVGLYVRVCVCVCMRGGWFCRLARFGPGRVVMRGNLQGG